MLGHPNFIHSEPSVLSKDAPAKFHLSDNVAKKNGGFTMAEKRVYFYTFKHRPSVNGGAAKILSFLGENRAAGLHDFQNVTALQPCCNEKWQIQYG